MATKRGKKPGHIAYARGLVDEETNKTSSARKAGYSHQSLKYLDKTIEQTMLEALDKAGLSPEIISEKLVEGFNAMKVDRQGMEHPDYDVRLKYIRTSLELLGVNKALKIDITSSGQQVNMTPEELRDLIATGTVDAVQKFLAERTVNNAEDAKYRDQ